MDGGIGWLAMVGAVMDGGIGWIDIVRAVMGGGIGSIAMVGAIHELPQRWMRYQLMMERFCGHGRGGDGWRNWLDCHGRGGS